MASRVKPVRSTTLLDKYRSVIVATAFIILSIPAFSQVRQDVRARGFNWEEGKFKRALIPPSDTLQLTLKDTGAIVYKGTPPRAYIWSNHSGVLRWDTTAGGSGGGSGEIVIPSFGIDKIGTVIKVDTSEISTFRALRDTAASIRSSAIGEVLTTQFGISKTGTTLKADTSQISTVRALQDTANAIRKLRSTLLARRSVQAVNDTTFQLVGDTTVNPNSGQKSLYGFNTDGSRGFIPVKEYDISTTIGELRAKAASATGAMIYRFQSADDVSDFRYDPSDNSSADDSVMVIVNGGRRMKRHYSYVDPYWFGAIPDDGIDDTYAMQKAVNFAINNYKTSRVLITHAGRYIVNDLLLVKYSGTTSQQVGVSLEGISASNGVNYVEFYCNNPNSSAIHVMQAKGATIRNISLTGANPGSVGNYITGDWTFGGTIRSNNITPHAAITIDEFYTGGGTTYSGTGSYRPTVPTYLYSNTHFGGSSGVLIENCPIKNFYVGIANGLSGAPNGEGVIYRSNLNSADVAYFWVAGQLQSRENIIEGSFWLYGGNTFITNVGFGTGLGDLPTVRSCNVNNIKYLFQAHGDFTQVRFENGYSEAVWSLGKSTSQQTAYFHNWNYSSLVADAFTNVGPSPIFFEGYSLTWDGGKIEGDAYNSGWPINGSQASFANVFIRGNIPFMTDTRFTDRVHFKNVKYTGTGSTQGYVLSEFETNSVEGSTDESDYNGRYFLPGSKFKSRSNRTYENIGSKIERIQLHTYAITLNASAHTATFTPDNVGRYKLNDLITTEEQVNYGSDIYSAAATALGYVTNISGGVVTVSGVPAGIVDGASYTMFVTRVPLFIGRTLGNLTQGSNVITGLLSESVSTTFRIGDRLKGDGIYAGAYVTDMDYAAGTITMSMTASATATAVELYDAKTKITAYNNIFNFFGGFVNVLQIGAVWNAGDIVWNVTGGNNAAQYCSQAGKVGSGTEPTWVSVGTDPNVVKNNIVNNMTSSSSIRFPANANNSAISVGGLNLQSYVADDGWMGMNVFEDATGWHRREYGTGGALRISYGTLYFHNTVDGAPGTNVTAPMVERFSVNPSGIMKVPSLATGGASQMVVANASGQFGIQEIPSSTNLYNSNGTMTGHRQVSGANFDIALGLTSSKFNSISLYSGGKINLYGLVAKGSIPVSTDANRTLPADVTNIELKANLTANRTLTLPDPTTLGMGTEMFIINVFDNTPFNWSFTTTVIDNKTGSTVTQIDHRTVYHLYVDASLQWRIIAKY